MSLIELSTALTLAGSGVVVPFVNKVLEKTADRLGGHLDVQLVALFTRSHHLLAATGREAQSVEPKLLKPIVENAPLETDPELAELWAALLANAADPAQRVSVQPGFAEVLRQLTPTDAQVAALLYKQSTYDPEQVRHALTATSTAEFAESLDLSLKDLAVSIDSLFRLRLCDTPKSVVYMYGKDELPPASFWQVVPTLFGFEFMQAVTPPTL